MRNFGLLVTGVCFAVFATASPAYVQSQAQDPIVVTGQSDPGAEVQRLANAIGGHPSYSSTLARFHYSICPHVEGVIEEIATQIEQRVANNATIVGLKRDRKNCTPNLLVYFVSNPRQVLLSSQKKFPRLFGSTDASQLPRLLREPGPVYAWTVANLKTRDGNGLHAGKVLIAGVGESSLPTLDIQSSSIINHSIQRDIDAVIILIDQKAAVGKSPDQIADYITMRGLTETKPDSSGATILSLFTSAEPPSELTEFDKAYIKSVYSRPSGTPASRAVAQIAGELAKDPRLQKVVRQ